MNTVKPRFSSSCPRDLAADFASANVFMLSFQFQNVRSASKIKSRAQASLSMLSVSFATK